jgi:uncharacterized protein
MAHPLGYLFAVLIGISLGLIGGGGSILTVPVLVYLMYVDPVLSTTYSLFIVGFTSLAGGTKAYMNKLVDFKAVSFFGIPSILTIFIARHFILPAIPEQIMTIAGLLITRGKLLMIIFALLMLVAAITMLNNRLEKEKKSDKSVRPDKIFSLLIPGLLVGLVTGLLGAGGGFLIIPALVVLIKLPMKTAVGTSLLIIAINSIFGFVFSIGHYQLNWSLLLSFTGLAVLGVFAGGKMAEKLNGNTLKKGFGWFVLVMSTYIFIKEIFL